MKYDKELVDQINAEKGFCTFFHQHDYRIMHRSMINHAGSELFDEYQESVKTTLHPEDVFIVEPDSNKASRFNTGKPELSYLLDAPVAVKGLCEVFAMGAEKYARDNWRKGLYKDQVIDSLLRHLLAYKSGEIKDSESGKCHSFHVLWNALVLAEQHSKGE